LSRRIRTYAELQDPDRSGLAEQLAAQQERVDQRLASVSWIMPIMSGKGGVGKSMISAGLAAALAKKGNRVGLLDADLQGPSAAEMLRISSKPLAVEDDAVRPIASATGVTVMSTALLLREGAPLSWRGPAADSFVWRGAEERRALREFLADVEWGRLDWLIVDLPPGMQRMVDLFELIPRIKGVVAVTIPAEAARASVERALNAVRARDVNIIGIVENMSGYACGGCAATRPLFPGNAGAQLAAEFDAALMGRIPFDPEAAGAADRGDMASLIRETAAGRAISAMADRLETEITAA
jgi:ATP-binding protein involved in chromosome partitioning